MSLHKILALWKIFSKNTFTKSIFSYLIRFMNPYTGRLGATINIFEKGYAEIVLRDKKKNRNHLNCVHAIALANLGEFTSGIAVLGSLPSNVRGIVSHISIEYMKKARGTLRAVSSCDIPPMTEDIQYKVKAEIFNDENELVSCVHVTWELGMYHE
ncbi:DUF4442 domain-containing protein [Sulfurimonas sp. MAG313]|nr:DUF4442 domain-containing protein [Sulfurimonas sp. MAG313]MDF1879976.1 DUF4442 domain-containing protein [Sulfurimonas sp. MAG313]